MELRNWILQRRSSLRGRQEATRPLSSTHTYDITPQSPQLRPPPKAQIEFAQLINSPVLLPRLLGFQRRRRLRRQPQRGGL